ncbi:hypothetical protein [Paludibacterium purpuratum]|uniref:Uncharacterized protein n=1 Tax=Paludibacterium purpuratum TaxID=1144873 RepID=A0A4R7B298_9NEIS|nr:hypothetical protein [Paludibacterium purpuratum]TDR77862.1 hypothetical protein DFP86_109102 [Paludibacterium purpuratum]
MLSLNNISQIYGSIASYNYSTGTANSSPATDASTSTSVQQDASNIRNGVQNQVNSAVAYAQSDPYAQQQLSNTDSTIVSLGNGADTYGSGDLYTASGRLAGQAGSATSAVQNDHATKSSTYAANSARTANEVSGVTSLQTDTASSADKK